MSRRCVGYEGEGRNRRPVWADEGPASAAGTSPVAMHQRVAVPGQELTGPTGGAGAVERRQLYDAENDVRAQQAREARATRPSAPTYMATPGERERANERRAAARRLAPRLERAWTEVGLVPPPGAMPGDAIEDGEAAETVPLPERFLEVIPPPPPTDAELADAPPAEDADVSRLTIFQQRVLAKVIEYGGDRRRVATEVNTRIESVDGTLERIGEKGLLPPTLIPLLPARFAKYAPRVRWMALPELDGPRAPAITERDLLAGYPPCVRTEACLCGGWIRALDNPKAIAYAVAVHNDTPSHRDGAIASGWRDG